jgi:hypothetical protein
VPAQAQLPGEGPLAELLAARGRVQVKGLTAVRSGQALDHLSLACH